MSLGDRRQGHRSIETDHSSFHNNGVYHSSDDGRGGSRSHETSHSSYSNNGIYHFGVDDIGGNRSQENSHFPVKNHGERVDVEGRGGYRSQTSHFFLRFSGRHGRFSCLSVSSCPVDENIHKY